MSAHFARRVASKISRLLYVNNAFKVLSVPFSLTLCNQFRRNANAPTIDCIGSLGAWATATNVRIHFGTLLHYNPPFVDGSNTTFIPDPIAATRFQQSAT
jgi:hypothetical protein